MLFSNSNNTLLEITNRRRKSLWQQFFDRPCLIGAQILSRAMQTPTPIIHDHPVTVVCISDTHNKQIPLPAGDLLIHAGDLTQSGSVEELQATLTWLSLQPHEVKIVIAGNHDIVLDTSYMPDRDDSEQRRQARSSLNWHNIIYLQNSDVTVRFKNGRRLQIFGSPLTPQQGNWAFQYPRSRNVWRDTVPLSCDILVTHGPPAGHLDLGRGCIHLLQELWRVKPRLAVFGHIHEGKGQASLRYDKLQAAVEATVIQGGGVYNFLRTFWHLLGCLATQQYKADSQTHVVNAAIVGGLRDQELREPSTVVI